MLDKFEKSLWDRNVAHKFEKRKLLIAVNLVAGLSIFFFGYDQGVMGGVNTTRDYVRIMKIGHYDADQGLVVVDHQLQQGGIVSYRAYNAGHVLTSARTPSTTFPEPSSAACLEDGSVINTAASRPCLWQLYGQLLGLFCSALPRTQNGCFAV